MINPFFFLVFLLLLYVAVLYESSGALALCLVLLLWIAGSIFQLLYGIRHLEADLPFSARSGKEIDQAVFTFTLKNTGILPLSGIQLRLLILDQSGKKTEEKKLFLSLKAQSRRNFSLNFSSPYYGRFQIVLEKIRLYSFFSLAWVTKKTHLTQEAVFLPQPVPVPLKVSEKTRYFTPEGEDTLETPFTPASASGSLRDDIHKYQPGDRLGLVHWKLSARTEDLLVRSPGSSEGFPVLLFLDLVIPAQGESPRQISAFLQCTASLSFSILEMGCSHLMVWFDLEEQCLRRLPVRSEEELTFALYCLLHGDFYRASKELYSLSVREHPTDTWSSRLLLDTNLNLWKEETRLFSSTPENWKEEAVRTEILL